MKLFGFGGEEKLDAAGEALAAALAREIAALDRASSGLGQRFVRYVATGDPIGVLAEIAANSITSIALRLRASRPRQPILAYGALATQPAATGLRYAKCLAAAAPGPQPGHGGMFALQQLAQTPWVEVLLMHASAQEFNSWGGDLEFDRGFTAQFFESLAVEDGLPADTLVAVAFLTDPKSNYYASHRIESIARMAGFAEAAVRHCETARPAFRAKAHEQRLQALHMLKGAAESTLACFAGELAACATESSKQVRVVAQPLLRNLGAAALQPLQDLATQGDPATRSHALRALWDLGTEGNVPQARELVLARRGQEKTRSVLETIESLQGPGTDAAEVLLEIPELPAVEAKPLPEALRRAFDQATDRINQAVESMIERSKTDKGMPSGLARIPPPQVDEMWDYISGGAQQCPEAANCLRHWDVSVRATEEMRKFVVHDGVSAAHIVRAFRALGKWRCFGDREVLPDPTLEALEEHYRAHGSPSFIELEAILAAMGKGHEIISLAFMGTPWTARRATGWDPADVWPFFARHMETLRGWLRLEATDYWFNRTAVFEAIGTFPQPPAEFVPRLFEIALGPGKTDRPHAQNALDKLPGKEDLIIAALADRKAETRAVAAQWLARLKSQKAVTALEAALRKETHDVAIGAMLAALEALGVAVDPFLDRDGLPKEAAKGLAKGVPAALAWFPWDAVPEVSWGEGQLIPPEVLKWLLVQAAKLKSPEPGALLRRYASMMVPAQRERLGQFVLDAWIAEDVRPIDREEAENRARTQAQQTHAWMKSSPQYWTDNPLLGKSIDEIYAVYLPAFLRQPRGSANDSKGVLALVAACAGREAAPAAARYLKEHYGTRAAQGKALIGMLAWIEHPSATQLMLSVGNRFRTKSFQDEAMRQAEALAERKGWSVAELADRTIPSAGFDESGELALPFGARTFTARLGGEFKVELFNEEGRKIAALPEPRKDEDEALAKDAKKAFSAAKKDVKTIVQMQTDRLYEALCTQRDWAFEDWDLYLNRHPLMRRLLQGLVWAEFRGGKAVASFRPLDDGTLTDVYDDPVSPHPQARVGLAHDSNLDAATLGAWQKHLADYKVAPTFQQFGKGTYALPEGAANEREVKDFTGHVLEAFALRGRATKLGYQRGAAEDAGWFYEYHKRFPTLGIEANLRFTGNGLPEENRAVALQELSFSRLSKEQGGRPSAMRLKDVPAVLLSECYNDMRLVAAEGTGFDPEWEKKTQL